jgi:hypothetical protein
MPIIDIRAHGGQFGEGKYRKNSKIPATVLSPPSIPVYALSNWYLYTYTSSNLSLNYDPFEDMIIGTHNSSSTEARIIRSRPSNLASISAVNVYSDNSGNSGSTLLSHCPIYVAPLNKYYCHYYTYPSGVSQIRVFNATNGTQTNTLYNVGIDAVLSRTADYAICFNSYHKKIFRLNFADDSITLITDLTSYVNPSCHKVVGWDKVIILDGTYTGITIPNANVQSPAFYHPPSNSIIRLKYLYSSNGGHYMEKYNPTNFSLIASYRLTNRNSVYNANWLGQPYYDSQNKILLVAYEDYGNRFMSVFPIADDGTIVGWNYGDTTGNEFNKYGRVEGGGFAVPVSDGLVGMQKEISGNYSKYLQTVKTFYTLTK